MARIKTVIFDVGGVLARDVWEAVWLTPEVGLADRLGVSPRAAMSAGVKIYGRFSRGRFSETAYWAEFSKEIGRDIPRPMIREAEAATLTVNPHARAVLRMLRAKGIKIGIASNNTAFWFPKQAAQVKLSRYADPDLIFASHLQGREKGDEKGLLELVARKVNPATTLFIDDRQGNLERAKRLGFYTLSYGALDATALAPSGHLVQPAFKRFDIALNQPIVNRRRYPVPLQ